jgi:hypothetical protein
MADLLPSRIEPLGDAAELGPDARPGRAAKAKPGDKSLPAPPPVDADEEEKHQLDEQA